MISYPDYTANQPGRYNTPAKTQTKYQAQRQQERLPVAPPLLFPSLENIEVIKARTAFYDELEYGDPKVARWHLQQLFEALDRRAQRRQGVK